MYVISVYVAYQEHSIVFHTWSDKLWVTSLSYFIGLLRTVGFENVFVFKSWCHSIYIYDNFVYLSGLSNFISMHLFYMYLHTDFPNQFSELENYVNGVVNLWTKVFNQINNNHCPRVTKRIKTKTT